VTATGAFLVLAAAAFFIAVNWNALTDRTKFMILAAITGLALVTGRRMRRTLPATAGVIYHLGAFMLPILAASILVHLQQPASMSLLVQGAVAGIGFSLLNRTEQSPVLKWGAGGGVVVFAAGVGSSAQVSSALVLVGFALVASILHQHRAAPCWALIAGLAPTIALADHFVWIDHHLIADLHLAGASTRLVSIAVGLAAALVLGREAHERKDLVFAAMAGACAVLGIVTGWIELGPTAGVSWAASAAAFVIIEVVAHLVRNDAFWGRPARVVAVAVELAAGAIVATAAVLAVPLSIFGYRSFDPAPLLAGMFTAIGFYLADLRRRNEDGLPSGYALLVGGGWLPASLGMAGAAFAGAVFGSTSLAVSGGVVLGFAIFFVVSGRPGGHSLAVVLATAAPVLAYDIVALAVAYAVVGAITIATAVMVRARMSRTNATRYQAGALAVASMGPIAAGMVVAELATSTSQLSGVLVLAGGAALAWALGIVIDGARPDDVDYLVLGWVPRSAAVFVIAFGVDLPLSHLAILAGAMTAVAVADGVRRRDPFIAGLAVITTPVATAATVLAFGGSWVTVGISFTGISILAGGIGMVAPRRWAPPAAAMAISHAAMALMLTIHDPRALGVNLVLLGVLGAVFAVRVGQPDASLLGCTAIMVGCWLLLGSANIHDTDAYVAPLAALLVVAGFNARRANSQVGSWVAYGPAIALMGGFALVEHISDGRGWSHGLTVLAIGVIAVLIGGTRRLAAPMLLGTVLLIALIGFECVTSSTASSAPRWVWPALGGSLLIAVGIAMERHDTGPVETGRRLVDVVHERFS